MTPEEQSGASGSAASRRSGSSRRRRSFRPGRRPPPRPRGNPSASQDSPSAPPEAISEQADVDAGSAAVDQPQEVSAYSGSAPQLRPEERVPSAPAGPAIQEAITQLQRINKDMEELLLEMQKALETLEEAEVQKYADERELESLRAAIRQLTRPRENHQRPTPQGQGRQDPRMRHSNRDRFRGSHRHRGSPPAQGQTHENAPASSEQPHESPAHEEEIRPEPPHEPEIPF
jgi:hypothetical protein